MERYILVCDKRKESGECLWVPGGLGGLGRGSADRMDPRGHLDSQCPPGTVYQVITTGAAPGNCHQCWSRPPWPAVSCSLGNFDNFQP